MSDNTEFHIQEFKAGNTRAYSHLYTLYQTALTSFAVSIIHSHPDAEDIVQNAYTKVWELRENFSNLEKIRAFLYTAVRNASYDYLRHADVKKKNEYGLTQDLLRQGAPETLAAQIERLEVERHLFQMFDKIASDSVKASYSTGKSTDEIGRMYGESGSKVRKDRRLVVSTLKRWLRWSG